MMMVVALGTSSCLVAPVSPTTYEVHITAIICVSSPSGSLVVVPCHSGITIYTGETEESDSDPCVKDPRHN